MKDRQLADAVELEAVLAAPRYLLLKHSKACGISTDAYRQVEKFQDAHPEVPVAWLDVRAQRGMSNEVADRTGVVHESPQAFWIRDGEVAWHASHFDITAATLTRITGS